MNLVEAEIKKIREKTDKMKEFILQYGIYPTMMYALKRGGEDEMIWVTAYVELHREGKVPSL